MSQEKPHDTHHDLSVVRTQFDSWRRQRVGRQRVPKELWAAAVSLLDRYPITMVSRELRINSDSLRHHRDGLNSGSIAASQPSQFLRLTPEQLSPPGKDGTAGWPSGEITCRVVIERVDGARLTLQLADSAAIEGLCSSFLR